MPTKDQKKQYAKLIAAGKRVIDEYTKKQDECDRVQTILEECLGAVDDDRICLARISDELDSRKRGIEIQEEQTKMNARLLSEGFEKFRKERSEFDVASARRSAQLDERAHELFIREQGLEEETKLLEAREHRIVVLEAMYSSPINQSPIHG